MSITQQIADLRREMRSALSQALAQLFLWLPIANVSSIGNGDALEKCDDAFDPGTTSKGSRPVGRISPFGFVSVPVKGLRGLALRLGTNNVFFIGIGPQQKYGPQDLVEGETAAYASPGQTTRWDKDGNIVHTPAGAGTVQLGGNAHPLPKWDTFLSAFNTFIEACAGAGAIVVGTTGIPTGAFLAAAQALQTAIAANQYNSQVAQNG